ncbi:MAG: DUF4432 family protein [Pseudomonadota bacterium]
MTAVSRFHLERSLFGDAEKTVATMGDMTASTFCYPSGIEALRITNWRGEIIVLPFKGQQVWSAVFDGRDLTMGSMFDEPVDTRNYLETYGAFFIHCGLTAIGAPGAEDDHPLHGEIPNAPFRDAILECDGEAGTMTLRSHYQHTKAFACNYRAEASVMLGADDTLLDISLAVTNLKRTTMDLMYLGHANFRPVDNGELIYAAPYDADHVRVRQSIPSHVTPKPGYVEFLAQLAADPSPHHVLRPELAFDPEVVFTLDMTADDDGYAHAMQQHPDGRADYIRFRPHQTPLATRRICRTADQQGLGMAFPSTSEVEGYTAEKAKGQFIDLAGGETWRCDIRLGALDKDAAAAMASHIDKVCGR